MCSLHKKNYFLLVQFFVRKIFAATLAENEKNVFFTTGFFFFREIQLVIGSSSIRSVNSLCSALANRNHRTFSSTDWFNRGNALLPLQ